MNKIKILILLIIVTNSVLAQNLGGHKPSINWQTIQNEKVKLIYPENLKPQAQRIADIISHIGKNNIYSVGNKSKKLDLVLQTQQVISNGFVSLAPYKSEFFAVGIQNNNHLGSIDWLDILSLHEYRHALQFANARRGVSKFFSYLFGQAGWAGAMNLSIPSWYFEGDAVSAETLLSNSGRGRMPSFYKELRANLLDNKTYSYMTARNGSYNRMLPSIYPMGFAICNYTRNNYGDNVWAKILKDAGSYRYALYPFSRSMKRHTNTSSRKMYKKALAQLKYDWEEELKGIELTNSTVVSPPKKRTVTNYQFAQFLQDGTLVAIKNSYKETAKIVQIKDKQDEKIINYGISADIYLSVNNNRFAWTELEKDIRRNNVNYNKIVTYDFTTGIKKTVCSKTKYFSPNISADGSKIAVVNISEQLNNNIVIINSENGEQIIRLPNPENDFISYPKWTKDGKHIVYIAKRKSKLALMKMNIETQKSELLTNWTSHIIGSTSVGSNYVYFSASFSGIDNIYAVNLNGNKQIKQLTSVKTGAYQACINSNDNKLVMSEFTSMGYELRSINVDKNIENYPTITYKEPKEQERYKIKTNKYEHNILDSINQGIYEEKPYKGLFRGMKFHSWFFDLSTPFVGLDLVMDNTLNDIKAILGLEYNYNDEVFGYTATISYARWFPVFSVEARFGEHRYEHLIYRFLAKVNEAKLNFFVDIPLSWVKDNYVIKLNTRAGIKFFKLFDTENVKVEYSDFSGLLTTFEFSILHTKALQNLMPRWGFKTELEFDKSVSNLSAQKLYSKSSVFLPALFPNHGLKIGAAFQFEPKSNDYIFENRFVYSRGYSAPVNDRVYKLSADYSFPLLYPNWGFAGITHFKRIRGNLFFDFSEYKLQGSVFDMSSIGAELIFDNTFLNLLPLSIGLRTSYLLDTDPRFIDRTTWTEVFLHINIF